jgi:predicted nuclease of restriction endonuclease-like (RecB) superfamily
MTVDDEDYYFDLLFYHRKLRLFALCAIRYAVCWLGERTQEKLKGEGG